MRKVSVKVQGERERREFVYALASNGYPVYVSATEGSGYPWLTEYYVVFEARDSIINEGPNCDYPK